MTGDDAERRRGNPLHGRDPVSGKALPGTYFEATAQDIDDCVRLAADAAGPLRTLGGVGRARLLSSMASELAVSSAPIIARAMAETALPQARLDAEMQRTINQLRMFGDLVAEGSWVDARIDPPLPLRRPHPRPDLRRMLHPIGLVVVFAASNFPLAFSVAGGDTASALAAGNPVVIKAHPGHPGTSLLVTEALRRALVACGLSGSSLGLVQGASMEVGATLVRHPLVRAGAFTGSTCAGRSLADIAAARPAPIPFFAEMGSVNPQIILPAALRGRPDALATGLHRSLTLGVGQFCTNPGLILLIDGPGEERFLELLTRQVAATPPGTMLNRSIASSYRLGLDRLAAVPGMRVLAAGVEGPPVGSGCAGAALLMATAATFLEHPQLHEEVFGPCGIIVTARDIPQLEQVLKVLPGQLTASIHMDDEDTALAARLLPLASEICGRVLVNDYPTGVEVCQAMHHGGPYPATNDVRFTSVGTAAIQRFSRPVCYQNLPAAFLPLELQDANPLGIQRLVDGLPSRSALASS